MRKNLLRTDRALLAYPIREMAVEAQYIEQLRGRPMIWENIGDPIAQGERIPDWAEDYIHHALRHAQTYAYTDTRGDAQARHFVAAQLPDDVHCDPDKDILFFNGLGEAINRLFNNLPQEARVLVPCPTYPTHATAERVHAGKPFIGYQLLPEKDWDPDVAEMEQLIQQHKDITAILVINPNNPTGALHSRAVLERIIALAKKYDLFVIFDEIYHNLVFEGEEMTLLAEIIGDDVPGISMKGISKDIPWPGARCGWLEFYNADKDDTFRAFVDTILLSKMMEVCSTTLPQKVFPDIFADRRFPHHLQNRITKYNRRADAVAEVLGTLPMVRFVRPKGVFYAVIELLDLSPDGVIPIDDPAISAHINRLRSQKGLMADVHFAYALLGAKNICVVPLSGFGARQDGFRMTLLQEDDAVFDQTLQDLRQAITAYYGLT